MTAETVSLNVSIFVGEVLNNMQRGKQTDLLMPQSRYAESLHERVRIDH